MDSRLLLIPLVDVTSVPMSTHFRVANVRATDPSIHTRSLGRFPATRSTSAGSSLARDEHTALSLDVSHRRETRADPPRDAVGEARYAARGPETRSGRWCFVFKSVNGSLWFQLNRDRFQSETARRSSIGTITDRPYCSV